MRAFALRADDRQACRPCSDPPQQRRPLPESEVTIAELLRQAGYATGLIGKWGLGGTDTPGHPNRQGFDSFFGYLSQTHAHNYYPSHLYRNEERVELPNQVPNEGRAGTGWATTRIAYSHDLFARESLEFVERHRHEPFFLYLAFTIPHANNEAGRLGKNGMEVPDFGEYAERDWPAPQKGLAAMITRMDADIGRLLDKIDDLGLGENTLVLFSSDNGPHKEGGNNPQFFHSSGPLRGIKRDLFEGGIRVPTIARMPGTVAAGTVSDHPSAFWDFLPTACEAAGIEAPSGLDGISYWPALTGRGVQAAHDYLYWEIPEVGGRQAIQQGDWKAIRHNASANPDGPVQLYNLAEDPGEERDLAERFPDLAHSLAQRMIEARGGKPFPKQGSRGRARSSAG
ncbi:MAG: Arylsulfatase [candidate division BRC1 bacterium ADurb.BinA364]|nr:MAG: Arylsulfatase [candidate division BRC1 bacterium ADurb.BinA364]